MGDTPPDAECTETPSNGLKAFQGILRRVRPSDEPITHGKPFLDQSRRTTTTAATSEYSITVAPKLPSSMRHSKRNLKPSVWPAADVIRPLFKDIVLTLENDELKIDVRGDLAGIRAVPLKSKNPAIRTGGSQVQSGRGRGI